MKKTVIRQLAAVIITILVMTSIVYAIDSREAMLSEANKLIKEKRYDEAIRLLTDFITYYPDYFDEAQKLLRLINKIDRNYNNTAGKLLDKMENDPTDQKSKLDMIGELEQLKPNPNDNIKYFVKSTRDTALATYNNAVREEIMVQGKQLIDSGNFADAVKIYSSGYTLYQNEFMEEETDESSLLLVLDAVKIANEDSGQLPEILISLKKAAEILSKAAAAGVLADLDAAWINYEKEALSLIQSRIKIAQSGWFLHDLYEARKKKNPELTDSSFLSFAFRFTLGTDCTLATEGIMGAYDRAFISIHQSIMNNFKLGLDALDLQAKNRYESELFRESSELFRSFAMLADKAILVEGLFTSHVVMDLTGRNVLFTKNLFPDIAANTIKYKELRDIYLAMSRLSDSAFRTKSVIDGLNDYLPDPVDFATPVFDTTVETFNAFRKAIVSETDFIQKEILTSTEQKIGFDNIVSAGFGSAEPVVKRADYEKLLENANDNTNIVELDIVKKVTAWETDMFENALAAITRDTADGEAFLSGTQVDVFLALYPSKAKVILDKSGNELQNLRQKALNLTNGLANEKPHILSSAEIMTMLDKLKKLNDEINMLIERNTKARNNANILIASATKAINEGNARIDESRNALSKNDFALARQKLKEATDFYDESLKNEYNPEFLTSQDQLVANLQIQINRAENDKVIVDTRKLMVQAKTLRETENYIESRNKYLEARNLWMTTHPENNPPNADLEAEIKYIQTIISAKGDRSVSPTDALYAEISQLLSLAKLYYNEGMVAKKVNNATAMQESFSAALKKIQDVKRIYPYNQEARVLELKISQTSDPEKFSQLFRNIFEDARTQLNKNLRDATTKDALAMLEVLREVNPGYPGIQDQIIRGEIILGLRTPPPDPKVIANSASQVELARRLISTGETGQAEQILVQVRANLRNARGDRTAQQIDNNATALLDEIARRKGASVVLELSAAARVRLNEVIGYFQSQDYLNSRTMLNQLFTLYPEARNYQACIDIDARLKARGY